MYMCNVDAHGCAYMCNVHHVCMYITGVFERGNEQNNRLVCVIIRWCFESFTGQIYFNYSDRVQHVCVCVCVCVCVP